MNTTLKTKLATSMLTAALMLSTPVDAQTQGNDPQLIAKILSGGYVVLNCSVGKNTTMKLIDQARSCLCITGVSKYRLHLTSEASKFRFTGTARSGKPVYGDVVMTREQFRYGRNNPIYRNTGTDCSK